MRLQDIRWWICPLQLMWLICVLGWSFNGKLIVKNPLAFLITRGWAIWCQVENMVFYAHTNMITDIWKVGTYLLHITNRFLVLICSVHQVQWFDNIIKQECIPVGCVPPAAVAVCLWGVGCLPQCRPGSPPPRVWALRPPSQQDPSTTPQVWAWRPPQSDPSIPPPGVGLETFPVDRQTRVKT